MRRFLIVMTGAALTLGCPQKPEEGAPRGGSTEASAGPSVVRPAQPPPSASVAAEPSSNPANAIPPRPLTAGDPETQVPAEKLPTEQDFEEEAEKKLTSANLELELDALEREIEN